MFHLELYYTDIFAFVNIILYEFTLDGVIIERI